VKYVGEGDRGSVVVSERAPKSHMIAVDYANVGQLHRPTIGLKETLVRTTVRHIMCGPTFAVIATCMCVCHCGALIDLVTVVQSLHAHRNRPSSYCTSLACCCLIWLCGPLLTSIPMRLPHSLHIFHAASLVVTFAVNF
jgi:hypothetical protein